MKFGFLSIGVENIASGYLARLSLRGYYPKHVLCLNTEEETKTALPIINTCDIVFVAGDRQKFCGFFDIAEDKRQNKHFRLETMLYIFLDDYEDIAEAEGTIREYYSSLFISMSVYRIFLEEGKTQDFESIFDEKKLGLADKYLLDISKNGAFLDIIIRHRNDAKIAPLAKLILDNYFNHIYATSFTSLLEIIATHATRNAVKIKLAESFTGGRLASGLTSIAGASGFFIESLVTYSDQSKHQRLGIETDILDKSGAVSAEVAFEMAKSLIMSGADIAVATTGNAGPTALKGGGVGRCYISVGSSQKIEVFEFDFCGSRDQITQNGVAHALFLLYRKLMLAYNIANKS